MAETFADLARDVRRIKFTGDSAGGRMVSEAMAEFARGTLADALARGEASPVYDLFVNNRPARSEDEVTMAGSILYVFSWWEQIITAALAELIKRSPRQSGRYASSFVVLVNGAPVSPSTPISHAAEVIITNVQPYTRKVEVGAMEMRVPPRLFEQSKKALDRQFGGRSAGFHCQVKYLEFSRGVLAGVPYILKGRQRSASTASLANWYQVPPDVIRGWRAEGRKLGTVDLTKIRVVPDRRSSAYRDGREFLASRRDTQAGQPLTYPSLVINLE